MQLIFEKSTKGHKCSIMPPCDVPKVSLKTKREQALNLPELSENEISRHYTELAENTHGVNNGFYPLGSCTMKYNPQIDEAVANLAGFSKIHPLQDEHTVQGALKALQLAENYLTQITGMDSIAFQPAAGAHGEFAGLLLIKSYHTKRNDLARQKIIVPDSAHGTNPASAAMVGYEVISVPSSSDGCVDLDALKAVLAKEQGTIAGLMLTNPNTVGIFDKNILTITQLIHEAGGLCYYDGANLNAVMGWARPGDMGFDVVHLNLHKTFATPHGGGGPGSGPIGCKQFLADMLPGYHVVADEQNADFLHLQRYANSYGMVKQFYGHFSVIIKALTYVLTLGAEGIRQASANAVLNANYMKAQLKDTYKMAFDGLCMHEFVMTLENLKHDHHVSALDVAKAMLDYGIHPPTMYFPLIVHEALMVEPTETESKAEMDKAIAIYKEIYQTAINNPELMPQMPMNTTVRRLDEVQAARKPILRYQGEANDK